MLLLYRKSVAVDGAADTHTLCSVDNKAASKSKESAGKASQAEIPAKASNELVEPALFKAKQYVAPSRTEALSHVNALAEGFVLLGISAKGAEEGWRWVLEGKNEPTLCMCSSIMN